MRQHLVSFGKAKKWYVLLVILLIVAVAAWQFYSNINCPVVYNPNHQAEVEDVVYKEINNMGYSDVMIEFEEGKKKEALESLSSTDLEIIHNYNVISAVFGKINRCGLEKLKNNEYVTEVRTPRELGLLE